MSHSNDKHIAVSVVKIPGLILHKEQLLKPYFYIRLRVIQSNLIKPLHLVTNVKIQIESLHEDILPTKVYDNGDLIFFFKCQCHMFTMTTL